MSKQRIRVAILGGGEPGLYAFGELHKHAGVEIAFVYDTNPVAVALEIAEILRVARVSEPTTIPPYLPLDWVVVSDDPAHFADELALVGNAEVLSADEAIARLGGAQKRAAASVTPASDDAPYGLDDALAGFERLFDRERMLKFLLDVAVDATGASNGSIMLYSPEARELYIAHATGLSERVVRNTRQKLGEGIAGAVAETRRGKLIREAAVGSLYESSRDRVSIASACSVPLVEGDVLLGVLNVSSARNGRELTPHDLATLEKLSARMARVLAESIKLREFQLRSSEMSLRQSVGELVEKSGSTAEKFALLSSLVAELTGAESVEVYVSTRSGEWLVLGGSNRRLATSPDFVRVGKGAMARAFLERRPIVLTEPVDPQSSALASSFVFVPLVLNDSLGVAALEFADRHRLDEFLSVRDSIALELARFVSSERRERRLRGELTALAKVSDSAPAVLSCRSLADLAEVAARTLADALECERVSFRVRTGDGAWVVARYDVAGRPDSAWTDEDDERFGRLEQKRASYHLTFLDFGAPRVAGAGHHSLLAVPLLAGEEVVGGVIAYDKRAGNAVEDAVFGPEDEATVRQVVAMVQPAARSLATGDVTSRPSWDDLLAGSMHRFLRVTEAEMARADRYHQPFSLVVVGVPALGKGFAGDETHAIALAEEIRQGIQTRTRKSDFGAWVRRDRYALVTLESPKRVRFLVSRLVTYLGKDLTRAGFSGDDAAVLIGVTAYPGAARAAETLLEEAERALKPQSSE